MLVNISDHKLDTVLLATWCWFNQVLTWCVWFMCDKMFLFINRRKGWWWSKFTKIERKYCHFRQEQNSSGRFGATRWWHSTEVKKYAVWNIPALNVSWIWVIDLFFPKLIYTHCTSCHLYLLCFQCSSHLCQPIWGVTHFYALTCWLFNL